MVSKAGVDSVAVATKALVVVVVVSPWVKALVSKAGVGSVVGAVKALRSNAGVGSL